MRVDGGGSCFGFLTLVMIVLGLSFSFGFLFGRGVARRSFEQEAERRAAARAKEFLSKELSDERLFRESVRDSGLAALLAYQSLDSASRRALLEREADYVRRYVFGRMDSVGFGR